MSVKELDRPAPPNLPVATTAYEQRYQEQLNNVHRLYYNRLTELLNSLLVGNGGRYLGLPHGSFYDTTDQTAASTTAAYPFKLGSTDLSSGVTVEGTPDKTKLTVAEYGVYNIQFSAQFVNTDTQIQDVDIWFRKNGADIANSNSRFSVPNSHGGTDGHLIAALNFFADLVPNDYIEIMWCTTNTAVSIQHLAAASSPTRPATPSIIATVAFVSRPE